MGKKPKRWNRWEKEEEKLRKLREQLQKKQQTQTQQEPIRHATEEKPQEPLLRWEPRGWEPRKLNREKIANLIVKNLRENPEIRELAEKLTHKLLQKILPELTEKVIAQMVEIIHREVLRGATVEIRGLATWKTKNSKIKVKNHIKPKQPTQP